MCGSGCIPGIRGCNVVAMKPAQPAQPLTHHANPHNLRYVPIDPEPHETFTEYKKKLFLRRGQNLKFLAFERLEHSGR
jgi:hypothetical protein